MLLVLVIHLVLQNQDIQVEVVHQILDIQGQGIQEGLLVLVLKEQDTLQVVLQLLVIQELKVVLHHILVPHILSKSIQKYFLQFLSK